jgi:glycosyltransferase involved in cell wall biosynthesis
VQDGINGYLAATPSEWVDKLSRLLADADQRARFAAAGRQTIEQRYSLRVTAPTLAGILQQALRPAEVGHGGRRS